MTLNRLSALEGIASNAVLAFQIRSLLELYEERQSLTAGLLGLRTDNPQVEAIDQRIDQAHAALRVAVGAAHEALLDREQAIRDELATLRRVIQTFPGKETRIAQLQLESTILEDTYRYLLGQYQQARLQEATIGPYVTILDSASPALRVGAGLWEKVMLGLLIGMLVGLAAAFFLDYLDQTIKTPVDVERVVGVPVLGLIPQQGRAGARRNGARAPISVVTSLRR